MKQRYAPLRNIKHRAIVLLPVIGLLSCDSITSLQPSITEQNCKNRQRVEQTISPDTIEGRKQKIISFVDSQYPALRNLNYTVLHTPGQKTAEILSQDGEKIAEVKVLATPQGVSYEISKGLDENDLINLINNELECNQNKGMIYLDEFVAGNEPNKLKVRFIIDIRGEKREFGGDSVVDIILSESELFDTPLNERIKQDLLTRNIYEKRKDGLYLLEQLFDSAPMNKKIFDRNGNVSYLYKTAEGIEEIKIDLSSLDAIAKAVNKYRIILTEEYKNDIARFEGRRTIDMRTPEPYMNSIYRFNAAAERFGFDPIEIDYQSLQ